MAGVGDDAGGAARSTVRVRGGAAVRAAGPVCDRATVGAGACSAGRVTVPLRLKFCNSLGPIVTGFVEFDVGAGAGVGLWAGAVWAGAAAGAPAKAAANNAVSTREIAFIRSRFLE